MWIRKKQDRKGDVMFKGIKVRAYPTKDQMILINKTLGCCRLVYNKALEAREQAFEEQHPINYNATSAMLTEWKRMDSYSYLKEPDSVALQQSLKDLDTAYQNFFNHTADHPKFKSKHDNRQTYRTLNDKNNKIRFENGKIRLPKVGWLKIKGMIDTDNIHSVTVEKKPSGRYFLAILTEFQPETNSLPDNMVGIDVGIKTFLTDSNGNKVENPKYLEKSAKKLKRAQRKLSRKVKDSNNRNKQRIIVARIHEKITNQRQDFLYKQAKKLLDENQVICVEDLAVKNLMHNHKLARSIASTSWSKFFNILQYKASWSDKTIVKVPRFYASSQICHCCGYKNKDVKDLKIRQWTCPVCNATHDRDINASINILRKGMEMISA